MKNAAKIAKLLALIVSIPFALAGARMLGILVLGTASYESLAGSQLAVSAVHKIDPILIAHGLCPTYKNECPEKDSISTHGIKYGEHFEIWGITDQSLLIEIAQIIVIDWQPTKLKNLEIVAHPHPKTDEDNQSASTQHDADYFNLKLKRTQP